ncbi:alpha-amylase [Eubacteriales bacterium OttesenSCG-928-K08]|nr:alpha-amylase [Eubacteriales bacterium OttesenSCG-928-K08]
MGKWTNSARIKAAQITKVGAVLTDQQAVEIPSFFMPWDEAAAYAAGERVSFNGLLYRCLSAHTAQASWAPDVAPSLWVRIDDPAEEWPAWVLPKTSEETYASGARVTHNGCRWLNWTDNNVWEPGVYGWEQVSL